MEKQLRYVLMLSLEEMALRRVAIALWNDSDILNLVANFSEFFYPRETWDATVLDEVADKMSKLQLPESFTKKSIPILKAVGSEILKWKMFHEECLSDSNKDFNANILQKLNWTTAGSLDYRKTAEELVCSDVVDDVKRYKLACLYCMDDYIPEFWKKLPEEIKMHFYNEENTPKIVEPPLEFCWPYILKGEESKLDYVSRRSLCRTWFRIYNVPPMTRFHQYAFEHSSFTGNKTAAEYFFQKLTSEEREACLFQTVAEVLKIRNDRLDGEFQSSIEKFCDVLCYLLSRLSSEEQIRIFKELPCEILSCFLEWPWQDLFMDIADVIWTFLPESEYDTLLINIHFNIESSGYYLPNLFQNLFVSSPFNFRKQFVNQECKAGRFFREFFKNRDTETVKVIFRNVDACDRVRLVTSRSAFRLLDQYIWNGTWHMVEVCIREAALSKENKERLKEDFMGHHECTSWTYSKWIRFFEFLDETDVIPESKRSSNDETLAQV